MYLDNAASTPMDLRVIEVITNHFKNTYGNASSLHSMGQVALQVMEESRQHVADLINANKEDIYFTSSGTESDNIAITGVANKCREKGNHIITTSIEHHAIKNTCLELGKQGFDITFLSVDKYGLISLDELEKSITDKTILIILMFGNNEIGNV